MRRRRRVAVESLVHRAPGILDFGLRKYSGLLTTADVAEVMERRDRMALCRGKAAAVSPRSPPDPSWADLVHLALALIKSTLGR